MTNVQFFATYVVMAVLTFLVVSAWAAAPVEVNGQTKRKLTGLGLVLSCVAALFWQIAIPVALVAGIGFVLGNAWVGLLDRLRSR